MLNLHINKVLKYLIDNSIKYVILFDNIYQLLKRLDTEISSRFFLFKDPAF
jgi:hypothetical protein